VGVAQFKRSGKRKYRNQPVFFEGIRFDSKLEMSRYKQLRILQKAGKIGDLETQARIPLHVQGQKIGHYIADFRYKMGSEVVIEDTKSSATKTPLYNWKKKHVLAEYGIKIIEIERK
tara:strand:- start:7763 stop:8113 length:351 start_codon:yes stop_codon:yes gene_type:complete